MFLKDTVTLLKSVFSLPKNYHDNYRVGDPHKMILLSAALDVIKRDNLVAMQNDSGAVLLDGLKDLEARFPGVLKASRGLGK